MPFWPTSLPQAPDKDGYNENPGEQSIRSSMDVGPPKVRRRNTAAIGAIACKFTMTGAQTGLLDTFYVSTVLGGSLTFDWVHPRTGISRTMRLKARPTYTPMGADVWEANCEFEVLP